MSAKIKYSSLPKRKHHLSITIFSRLTLGLFLLGFALGCLSGNLLKQQLYEPVLTLFQNTVNCLPSLNIRPENVFFYSLKDNLKLFLLLVFFALTNVWKLYYTGFTLYTGFAHGLLLSFCLLLNDRMGILQYLCFLLPQALLLVPVFLYVIIQLEQLHSQLFSAENSNGSGGIFNNTKKRQLIFSKLPLFLLCILLFICCAFLEGYLNIPLLKYFHSKVI